MVLSSLAVLLGIASFPFTDDYFWVGIGGMIVFLFSLFIFKAGRNNIKISKVPIVLIITSFIVAILPLIILNFIFCRLTLDHECSLAGALLFLFVFGPIGGILFLIGIIMLYLQTRKKK